MIATWAFLRDRWPAVVVGFFGLSLTLKPQLACIVWAYFFLANSKYRQRALLAAGAAIVFSLPGLILAASHPQTAHWMHDLAINLNAMTVPGNVNDPSPHDAYSGSIVNLQSIVLVFRDDLTYANRVTWIVSGIFLAMWAFVTIKAKPSMAKDLLGIGAASLLTLLPMYHHSYDIHLLLLMFPALAILQGEGPLCRWFGTMSAVMLILL